MQKQQPISYGQQLRASEARLMAQILHQARLNAEAMPATQKAQMVRWMEDQAQAHIAKHGSL